MLIKSRHFKHPLMITIGKILKITFTSLHGQLDHLWFNKFGELQCNITMLVPLLQAPAYAQISPNGSISLQLLCEQSKIHFSLNKQPNRGHFIAEHLLKLHLTGCS